MGKRIWFSVMLLAFTCLPANSMKERRCPPTGRGYSISYTFRYDFEPEHVEVVYPNVCSADAQW